MQHSPFGAGNGSCPPAPVPALSQEHADHSQCQLRHGMHTILAMLWRPRQGIVCKFQDLKLAEWKLIFCFVIGACFATTVLFFPMLWIQTILEMKKYVNCVFELFPTSQKWIRFTGCLVQFSIHFASLFGKSKKNNNNVIGKIFLKFTWERFSETGFIYIMFRNMNFVFMKPESRKQTTKTQFPPACRPNFRNLIQLTAVSQRPGKGVPETLTGAELPY